MIIKIQQTVERQLFSMFMKNTTTSDTHSHLWPYVFYWQKIEQIKRFIRDYQLIGQTILMYLAGRHTSMQKLYKLHFAEIVALFL